MSYSLYHDHEVFFTPNYLVMPLMSYLLALMTSSFITVHMAFFFYIRCSVVDVLSIISPEILTEITLFQHATQSFIVVIFELVLQ